jgi:hypothetical protein
VPIIPHAELDVVARLNFTISSICHMDVIRIDPNVTTIFAHGFRGIDQQVQQNLSYFSDGTVRD